MNAIATHILVELSGCNTEILRRLRKVRQIMLEAATEANACIVGDKFYSFGKEGVSGVVLLRESHISIHTWPELSYAAVDIYTCGNSSKPWRACRFLSIKMGAQGVTSSQFIRGVKQTGQYYDHLLVLERIKERGLKTNKKRVLHDTAEKIL